MQQHAHASPGAKFKSGENRDFLRGVSFIKFSIKSAVYFLQISQKVRVWSAFKDCEEILRDLYPLGMNIIKERYGRLVALEIHGDTKKPVEQQHAKARVVLLHKDVV